MITDPYDHPHGLSAWCLEQLPREDCLIWPGVISKEGYGQYRLIWSKWTGLPAPKRPYNLDHLCRVRACVNPDHLEVVTHRENIKRGTGPFAEKANATHCIHGHPLSGDNLYVRPQGQRKCRTCARQSVARFYKRNPRSATTPRDQ